MICRVGHNNPLLDIKSVKQCFPLSIKNKNIKFVKKDLSKKITSNIKSVKYIFHLAGSVGVKNINKNPLEAFLNNTLTCKNVVRFSDQIKEKSKIILFSTSEV